MHAEAGTAADTDWAQIEVLYGMLADLTPGPVVTLNHAVAVARCAGRTPRWPCSRRCSTTRACAAPTGCTPCTPTCSSEPGALDEARAAYAEAARLATSIPEQRYLQGLASR